MARITLRFVAIRVTGYDALELLCTTDDEICIKMEPFPDLGFQQVLDIGIRFRVTLENQIPALQ